MKFLQIFRPVCCTGVSALLLFGNSMLQAQQAAAASSLPDSPGFLSAMVAPSYSSSAGFLPEEGEQSKVQQQPATPAPVYAHRLSTKINAGMLAQPLHADDKFEMSITRQLTLGTLGASLLSSGYSHLADNRPHYGTDKAGFGERLGASALRSTTQSVFNFGLYSNVFHDDPRYYVLGDQHPFKQRVIYAATRVVFTRKDDGRKAINYPYLAAVVSAAALTNAYYPDRDRSVGKTAGGVGTTIALNAAVMQLNEFGGDIKKRLFHKH